MTESEQSSITGALRRVLEDPGIRRVEIAWMAGIVADWAYLVAMLVVAYRAGGALGVGILGVVRMLPGIFLGPFAALPMRLFGGERALLAVHATRTGAAVLSALLLAAGGPVAGVYVLAAVVAGGGVLVRPIQSSLLPAFARSPGELVAANVASSTGEGVGTFAGPVLGGIVLAVGGPVWACAIAAAIGAVGVAAVVGLQTAESVTMRERRAAGSVASPVAAIRALAERPAAAVLVGDFFAQTIVRGLLTTLIVVVSVGLLGLGEPGVGLLTGAIGAGGLIGGVFGLTLAGRQRLAPAFAVALAFWGLPIAVIGAVPFAALAVAALIVTGASNALLDVSGFTLLQRDLPNRSRMAVFALFEGLVALGVAVGSVGAPLLLAILGTQGALVATGLILPVLAVVTWPRISRTDAEVVVPAPELALLREDPIFAPLPMTALERLADAAEPVTFAPEQRLMTQGESGDRYLLIASGAVDVIADGELVRKCGPGNGIGEIALLRHGTRTATAIARTPVEAYAIGTDAFLEAVSAPFSWAAAISVATHRLGDLMLIPPRTARS